MIISESLSDDYGVGGTTDQLYPLARPTISILPDDVLLEIFNFCMDQYRLDAWHTLVHVCQRWRHVVFGSPRRLDLQLLCTNRRSVMKMLDIWPALPIYIYAITNAMLLPGVANVIAALKQHDRVCGINIPDVPSSLLKEFVAMEEPLPALTSLLLGSNDENAPVLPDSFLGGSAPRLRQLSMSGIPFPALPKLILSTTDLVHLTLYNIPHSGYISPDAMVNCLSTLTRLNSMSLEFRSPQSRVNRESRRLRLPQRVVFPALTSLRFRGDVEYLEAIASRIHAPLLESIVIILFNRLIFDTPMLRHFISRIETFDAPYRAKISISTFHIVVDIFQSSETALPKVLGLYILCQPFDWQLSSLAQVCSSALPPLPTLEWLEIYKSRDRLPQWQNDVENMQWLELLHPFTSVRELVLSEDLVPLVAPALQELTGERVTEVLPALQNIFLRGPRISGPVKKALKVFTTARRLSGRPVTVHN